MALHVTLGNDRRAPREGRQAIADFLAEQGLAHLIDDAALLASELVTNAVNHAQGPIDVRAYVREGHLRLEVGDCASDSTPQRRVAAPDDEGGRGMELVELLASDWGWQVRGDRKVVWLEIPLS